MAPSEGFPGVVGHANAQRLLRSAMARGRLSHALILAGPRGIGKATLARGLACALNCTVRPHEGCGQCPTCMRILSERHPDFVRLTPEVRGANIKADDTRAFALGRHAAPFESAAHVALIDPADALLHHGANALLKAIEEPRPGVHYVLITHAMSTLLDTLKSRCVPLHLAALSLADTRRVVDVLHPEDQASPHRALAIQLSGGRPGVAVEYLRDGALEQWIELVAACERAAARGPAAIFCGERAPLWATWRQAALSMEEPVAVAAPSAGATVTRLRGKKRPAGKKATARGSKSASKKATARQQRLAAARLSDVWMVHLRARLTGEPGLFPDDDGTEQTPAQTARWLQQLLTFRDSLRRNPNVRLSLERTLLEMHP